MKITTEGTITEAKYNQFGHIERHESGNNHVATIDLTFQKAANDQLGTVSVNGNSLYRFLV